MRANYYGSPNNSSWLTHVAASTVTDIPEHQFAEGRPLVFAVRGWDRSSVRLLCAALLIVTWLRGVAMAGPGVATPLAHDPDAAVTSPWIDVAPALVLTEHSRHQSTSNSRLISALSLAGVYVGFSAWAYIAWYRDHPEKVHYDIGGD